MKKIILSLITIVSAISASASDGVSVAGATYKLTKFEIAKDSSGLGEAPISSGQVELSRDYKTLKLTLQPRFYCPPLQYCAQVMPGPIEIKLPVVSVIHPFCGGMIVIAEYDARPADGLYQRIELYDESTNFCLPKDTLNLKNATINYIKQSYFDQEAKISTFQGYRVLAL